MVKVINDNKVLAYAFNPRGTEKGESTVVKVINDNKVLIYAPIPTRSKGSDDTMMEVSHDNKMVVHAINTEDGERREERGERRPIV